MSSATTRESVFRRSVFLAAAGIGIAVVTLLAGVGGVRGQGGVTFGIRPADESTGAYFSYTLEPGARKTDSAIVTNNTAAALTLKVYPADAITASGGGTAFAGFGERRTGVAGIVVEAPPKAGTVVGSVNTTVTERAGVAIVVRVPGAATEKLAIGNVCFNQETGSRYFEFPVKNQGAVLSTATGTFRLETDKGVHVFERSVEIGSVIPTLETAVRVHSPQDPPPGKYTARLVLTQKDGQEVARESNLTVSEKKVNSCRTEEAKNLSANQNSDDNFGVQTAQDTGSGVAILPLLLLPALGVGLAALAFLLWRNRRPRSQGGS